MDPIYAYKILTKQGEILKGHLKLGCATQVREVLNSQASYILSIKAVGLFGLIWLSIKSYFFKGCKPPEMVMRSLMDLTHAGISIDQAIKVVALLLRCPSIDQSHALICQGYTPRDALEKTLALRDRAALNFIEVGSKSSRFPQALQAWLGVHEGKKLLKQQAARLLAYPLILVGATSILLHFITSDVLPQIIEAGGAGTDGLGSPDGVSFIKGLCAGFNGAALALLTLSIGFVAIKCAAPLSSRCRTFLDFMRRNIPMGQKYFYALFYQFFYAFSQIMPGQTDQILKQMRGLRWPVGYAEKLQMVEGSLAQGVPLGKALLDHFRIDLIDQQLLEIGQATNSLALQAKLLGEMHFKDLMVKIDRLIRFAGPFTLVCIGSILIVIILSVFMPLYDMAYMGGV